MVRMTKDFCDITGKEINGGSVQFEVTVDGVKRRYTVSAANWKATSSKFENAAGHIVIARNPYGRSGNPAKREVGATGAAKK